MIHDLTSLSQFTIDLVLKDLSSTRGSLMLVDDQRFLRIQAARGLSQDVIDSTAVRVGDGIAGHVASCGQPLLVENGGARPPELVGRGQYHSHSFLSVPVPGDRAVLGVMNVTEPVDERAFVRQELDRVVTIAGAFGIALDRAMRYREAEELAVRDELTGLYNRRYLWSFLDAVLERARGEAFPVTLLIFDIDHFKRFNDQFGHPAGDQVLREVADLMRLTFRSHDVICRLGGEEFAVVLWDGRGQKSGSGWQGHPAAALEFAERLRQATMHHRFAGIRRAGLTLSGGLATFPWDAVTRTGLVEQADDALYRAKRGGRNRVYLSAQTRVSSSELGLLTLPIRPCR
jgi:diguanylate cyclase (GGDEF)-like protein